GREAELLGLGESDRHHTVFEGEGRVTDGVVLYPEVPMAQCLTQPAGPHQGGEANVKAHLRGAIDRQELDISPKVLGASRDDVAGKPSGDLGVVVRHLERSEAELTYMQRFFGILLAAFAALQPEDSRWLSFGHHVAASDAGWAGQDVRLFGLRSRTFPV